MTARHTDTLRQLSDHSGFVIDAEGGCYEFMQWFPHFDLPSWIGGVAKQHSGKWQWIEEGTGASHTLNSGCYVLIPVEIAAVSGAVTHVGTPFCVGTSEEFERRFMRVDTVPQPEQPADA